MKKYSIFVLFVLTMMLLPRLAFSHCEIPCGIYDDQLRAQTIAEHLSTIKKSMTKIKELSATGDKNYNQIVRWVSNKEEHANEIQDIVHQYFMTQRIKPVDAEDKDAYAKYVKEVTLLHQMLVYAMKTKQTTDVAHVEKLQGLLDQFSESYFGHKIEAHAH